MSEESVVLIHTDGACLGNPGPGGWGALLHHRGRERSPQGRASASQSTPARPGARAGQSVPARPCASQPAPAGQERRCDQPGAPARARRAG